MLDWKIGSYQFFENLKKFILAISHVLFEQYNSSEHTGLVSKVDKAIPV